jgi:hypothetical protein
MRNLKVLGMLVFFILAFSISALAQNVNVTATAGTLNATYPTLTDAFNAVNAGTHQGAITMDIIANTTEPGPAVLNSNAAAPAAYTSVLIRPTVDGVTISGATASGRGLIELNAADSVTIDGDNPNTGGVNRNLTLTNTAANTVTYTSVIRIALAATVNNSADNNIFKNLNVNGSATGRNVSTATSTTGSENTTYGILAGYNASTTSPTTAPVAVTSISGTVGAGATANNLLVDNNVITNASRGVATQGAATTVFPGLVISNNTIGNPVAGAADGVYANGVMVNGSANAIASGNTVYVEGWLASSASNVGINVGSISTATNGTTVEKNKINRVTDSSTSGFNAYGINLAGGNSHIVRNNFVSGITNFSTASFSTTFSSFGIRVATGTGHVILHNSVNMYGALTGPGAALTAALCIVSATSTGMDIRNNIFQNVLTGAGTTGTAHVSIYLPASGTSAMNLTLNNNAYYTGTTAGVHGVAHVGATYTAVPAGPATYAGLYTVLNFDPSTTAPSTNFRAYSSTLSAAGTNDNASFASTAGAPFTSNTDLHIPAGTQTRLESGGAAVGVTTDIDNEARNATTPDIGADEFAGVLPPANDIAANAFVTPANSAIYATGTIISPQASFTNAGIAAQTNVTVQFTITGPGGYNYSNQQIIPAINPGQTITVTFAAAPAFTTVGTYNMTAQVITADANTANDIINGTFSVAAPVSGTVSVGAGGDFPSLTNPGGVFDALNATGASSNVVINITSDLTGETGSVALNQLAGGFTVTIKPSGAARSITSTSSATTVIKLNEADNVTIDGSLSGGTDRSLSITNINPGATTAVIWLGGTVNGAQNNTIKNLNLAGGFDQSTGSTFNFAIIASSASALLTGGTDLDNNTYTNNFIRKVSVGIITIGGLATNMNQNTTISNNLIGPASFGSDQISTLGILAFNENATNITGNEIRFIGDLATAGGSSGRDHTGISLCTGNATWSATTSTAPVGNMTNANVSRNRIHDIVERATFSSAGIVENCPKTAATNNTFANNMIYNILANGTSGDQTVGIGIWQGNGDSFVHNSIYLTGDIDPGAATTASQNSNGFFIGNSTAANVPVNVTLRNNISFMDLTSNTVTLLNSAIAIPAAFVWGTGGSNFNDWYAPAANPQARVGQVGATFHATLAAWQGATSQDANSVSADPLFTSPTDLHLTPFSTGVLNLGSATTPATTNDYDNDPRPSSTAPDIGADELIQGSGGVIPAGTYYNVSAPGFGSLSGPVTVTGVLFLSGPFNANGNNLTIACGATVSGASATNFVYGGPVVKQFCAPEVFVFPVGTSTNNRPEKGDDFGFSGSYSPVTANVTAVGTVPSSLSVVATDSFMAGVDTVNSVDRFWTLLETGDVTTDLTFQYTDNDVNGNESLYKVLRRSGGITTAAQSSTVNTGANTGTVLGVQNFSDWSVGLPLAVAASVNVGGRVTGADGVTGLPRVDVTISGGTLSQPLVIRTSPFGYYNFEDLPVGTYILTVASKRYTFNVPTRVITAEDNIINADFMANE